MTKFNNLKVKRVTGKSNLKYTESKLVKKGRNTKKATIILGITQKKASR